MQIILNQAEVSLAIQEYLFQRVDVGDGISISVDLKSTRGENGGVVATVDLIEVELPDGALEYEDAAPAVFTTETVAKPEKQQPKLNQAAQPKEEATPAPKEEVASTTTTVGAAVESPSAETVSAEPEVVEPEVAEVTATEEVEPVAPTESVAEKPATKSLFGGLKRPNNAA